LVGTPDPPPEPFDVGELGGVVVCEVLKGDRCAVFRAPDDITGAVIDNQRQIFAVAFPGDLIDTDVDEPLDA
jgi:hypothetical protein